MARDDGEQRAMTAERLAEIRRGIEVGQMDLDEDEAFWAIRDLLAEVERLRAAKEAREAALMAFAEMVESNAGVSSYLREQARALLASTGEGSGGDGAL